MMAPSSGNAGISITIHPAVISTCLFVGSALLSTILSENKRRKEVCVQFVNDVIFRQASVDDSTIEEEEEDSSHRNFQIAAGRRLSYHDYGICTGLAVSSSSSGVSDEDDIDRSVATQSAVDYFYPKNTNWNHFEHYSMQDYGGRMCHSITATPSSEFSLSRRNSRVSLQEADTMDSASVASSDVSLISQDHFVWMNARYHEHSSNHNRKKPPTVPTMFSAARGNGGEPLPVIQSGRDFVLPDDFKQKQQKLKRKAAAPQGMRRSTSLVDTRQVLQEADGKATDSLKKRPLCTSSAIGSVASTGHCTGVRPWRGRRLQRATSSPPEAPSSTRTRSKSMLEQQSNREARASHNARIMPSKVVLARHGQSMGNINEQLYSTTPDNAMPLTKLGWEQAKAAGKRLKDVIFQHDESVHFIVSPYVRTVETFHGIVSAWCDPSEFDFIQDRQDRVKAWYGRLLELGLTWHEDPRIREQDFGNYQDPEKIKRSKRDRNRFGAFYYRFAHGESASDVYDRVSTFLDSLWRSFEVNHACRKNYVLVTHGISIRVLLARYFRYTIEQFHLMANPRNCELIELGHDGFGRLAFLGRHEQEVHEKQGSSYEAEDGDDEHDMVYKFHRRLRVVPIEHVHKVKIRISYSDKEDGPPEV